MIFENCNHTCDIADGRFFTIFSHFDIFTIMKLNNILNNVNDVGSNIISYFTIISTFINKILIV